ncbi:hypothetical protein C0J52_27477 [Blattella germanica]|nr:hypothetical protein C0J52_27477 [Blattella germanica]
MVENVFIFQCCVIVYQEACATTTNNVIYFVFISVLKHLRNSIKITVNANSVPAVLTQVPQKFAPEDEMFIDKMAQGGREESFLEHSGEVRLYPLENLTSLPQNGEAFNEFSIHMIGIQQRDNDFRWRSLWFSGFGATQWRGLSSVPVVATVLITRYLRNLNILNNEGSGNN